MAVTRRTGTQAIDRVVSLLAAASTRRQVGWRLVDLAARCDLDKGTAHRILTALVRQRMVVQRDRDRHYFPGPMLFELALSLSPYWEFREHCETSASRLARQVKGIGFFFLRSGSDMVCAARHSTVQATTIETGMRRPLLGSAGGIAMLILLDRRERASIVAENAEFIRVHGGNPVSAFKRMLRRSEKLGFGINESDLVPDWNTLGLGMLDPAGQVFGSVMVAGPARSLDFARLDHWLSLLRSEIERLQRAAEHVGLWHAM